MVVVVLGEGEAVGHVLREDLGAFVTVIVMVVVTVVVVAVVILTVVVVAVVVVIVVVMSVSATHLQHDKVEGFDARGFEFKHVIAFFHAVDVNHGVRRASSRAVDGFLGCGVFVAFMVIVALMLILVVMRFGDEGVVEVGRSPSDVLGLVQHHVIDANLADVPVVAGLVPDIEGPVPRGVGFDAADACDHVAPGAKRGVPGDVVGREGSGGQVPAGPVLVGIHLKGHRGVVWVVNNDHMVVFFVLLVVIMLFFLRGEVRCLVGSFVEVLAQVSDEDRLKLKRDVTVRHGVGGHGVRGRGAHRVKRGVNPLLKAETVVEEEVCTAERHDVGGGRLVVVNGDVGWTQQLNVHEVTAHRFSELLHVVGGDHDGSKTVLSVVTGAEAAGEARGDQHQGKEQRRRLLQVHAVWAQY